MATIFVLALIPFTVYAFIRPDLRGFDSYAFLAQSCGQFKVNGTPYLAEIATKALPCNILAIKTALFALFFISLLGIASLGSLFHKEKGWMAALFSFLSPVLFFHATKFENDQFATPILIWATFFFYKARVLKQRRWDFACFLLLCLAALFWEGAIYFLIAFGITSLVLAIPAIASLIAMGREIIGEAMPKVAVEAQAGVGIAMVGGLALGFALLPTIMYPQVVIFFLLMVAQLKFAWMIAPLLSVGVLMFYTNKKLESNSIARQVKGVLLMAAIFMVVVWGFALTGHPPHVHHWQAVEFAIQESEEGFVWNDWDMGYWILYKGGTPSQYGGGEQQPFGEGIVITRQEQQCKMLKEFEEVKVYRC